MNQQLGVDMSDSDIGGRRIREFPAERFLEYGPDWLDHPNNWYPLDGYKHTLCGRLQWFAVYDNPAPFLDEMDWNNFIIPDPDFMYLFEDALPYKGGDGIWCLSDEWSEGVKAEITPDEEFFESPWFPKSTENSPFGDSNATICVYCPWVRECMHGNHPEIHPSEAFVVKDKWLGDDRFLLLQIHDDLDRFDTEDHFEFNGGPPPDWHPWAAAPRKNTFNIPFALNPNTELLQFSIIQSNHRYVRTKVVTSGVGIKDDPSRPRHTITYNGKVVVEAYEFQPIDEDINIGFAGIFRNDDGTRLQGYLQIGTAVSENTDGKEGFYAIYVIQKELAPSVIQPPPPVAAKFTLLNPPPPPQEPKLSVSSNPLLETLTYGVLDGQTQLFRDIRVQFRVGKNATANDLIAKSVEVLADGQHRQFKFSPDPQDMGGVVKGVPLIGSEKLEITLASGTIVRIGVGGFSLSPGKGTQCCYSTTYAGGSTTNAGR